MVIDINKHVNEFVKIVENIPYGQSGMFNSEIFMIYVLYKEFQCNMFIESGIDNGVSTRKFLEFINDEYVGLDINSNCYGKRVDKDNFYFTCADANLFIPKLVEKRKQKDIFVMIDGPKNLEASMLKNNLLSYENVKFVAIHDTWDGLENDNYLRIFETKNNSLFYQKYFDILNMKNAIGKTTIYNLINYDNRYYVETYPKGPGVSIYSKIKFDINL